MEKTVRNEIDKIWLIFAPGVLTNPLTVIEQLTYLFFIKSLDDKEIQIEKNELLLGIKTNKIFDEKHQDCRWSKFKDYNAEKMYKIVQEDVFPFIKEMSKNKDSGYSKYMEDAIFMIPTPVILEKLVSSIDKLDLNSKDSKGDIYEYMLSKLSTAGLNGQFRTPRHIIKMIVELVKPNPEDIIVDPAAGTSGFLVEASEYLRRNRNDLFYSQNLNEHFNNTMFYGFDMDRTMLRIGAMNLMQHGIENPNIMYKDSVSEDNEDRDKYTLVLANPPFKGSIDDERISKDLLTVTKTKKTELLFLALFLRILKNGGRCASIVPDGVLFGSSNAHKAIRKEIIENHKLEAIISMPSGVFKPYAGVSTAIMIFTKTTIGGTDKVWFYDMTADGYSLDDQRQPIKENDIPDIINRFNNRNSEEEQARTRTEKSFFVTKEEIVANDYDLSINKYKEIIVEKKEYEKPEVILKKVLEIEDEIQNKLKELEDII